MNTTFTSNTITPAVVARSTPSYFRFTAYFLPLAISVSLQMLTYPLVAAIAARAEGGALNSAALAQTSGIVSLLLALCAGIQTAGMVYAKTRKGYEKLVQVNYWITAGVTVVYLILLIPPVSHHLFDVLLGLPATVARPAKLALLLSLPMNTMFYLRTPYTVVIFVQEATYLVFLTGLTRVVLTLLLTLLFLYLGAAGVFWAIFCMTISVAAESYLLRVFARKHLNNLPFGELTPRRREILGFVLTLSVGVMLLSFSGFMIGAFIARAPTPERMLPVYYLVLALVSTFAHGMVRIQTLTLNFYGRSALVNRRLLIFTLFSGFIIGGMHLVFLHPHLLEWYYSGWQGLPIEDLSLVISTSLAMLLFAPAIGLRSYAEGIAAYHKKPMIVLTGQAIYLAMVATCAFFALNLRIPGHLIGPLALFIANTLGAGGIFLALCWESRTDLPVPETVPSQNPH